MLSVPIGANAPLSSSAQATISKHIPQLLSKHFIQKQNLISNVSTTDVGCLTELCSGEHLSEIEIFSLLEEQIPKYKVRSDFLTDFTGYSNQDWYVSSPALSIPAEGLGLTKVQTRETLNYFQDKHREELVRLMVQEANCNDIVILAADYLGIVKQITIIS